MKFDWKITCEPFRRADNPIAPKKLLVDQLFIMKSLGKRIFGSTGMPLVEKGFRKTLISTFSAFAGRPAQFLKFQRPKILSFNPLGKIEKITILSHDCHPPHQGIN